MSRHTDVAVEALEALAAGDVETMERLYARDFVFHSQLPGKDAGHNGLRDRALLLSSSLYDAELLIDLVVEGGDYVTCRWRGRAVHKGDLLGIRPTGRSVEVGGLTLFRFAGDQIVAEWTEFDSVGLLNQLDALPSQRAPRT